MSTPQDKAAKRRERRAAKSSSHEPLLRLVKEEVRRMPVKARTTTVEPLNEAQARYDNSIKVNQITFGIGPAGTGKTWLAAMRAAEALQARQIERIIVTRPSVSADEELGFLPGELEEKYEPYFRPVREALEEFFGSGHLEYLIKAGVVEARPLGLLRGSTIKHAWLIADEMQNATVGQTKLLLSRIGENAKFIINGDPTQCDLKPGQRSGLLDAVDTIGHLRSVGVTRFTTEDIVRSGLCQEIVNAYAERHASLRVADDYMSIDDTSGVLRTLKA